jgi:hypothetical protein
MIAQLDKEYIKLRPTKAISRFISYALFEGRPATTSGRWINPLIFGLFSFYKKSPQLKRVKQPVYIIGTGRSGTTILGVVLSMHRQIGFLNEPKALWHSAFPFEDVIGSYTKKNGTFRLSENDLTGKTAGNFRKLYAAYSSLIFSQRVLDKYPEVVYRVPFVKAVFPDAKFIFLVRNPWDTCHSIAQWSVRKGLKADVQEDWWGVNDLKWKILLDELVKEDEVLSPHYEEIKAFTDDKYRALIEWYLCMKEGLNIKEEYASDILLLRYEDLVQNSSLKLNEITKFCQLNEDAKMIAYAANVLKPAPNKSSFLLPDFLEEPIRQLSVRLNYSI